MDPAGHVRARLLLLVLTRRRKQFNGDATLCSVGVDENWTPSIKAPRNTSKSSQ